MFFKSIFGTPESPRPLVSTPTANDDNDGNHGHRTPTPSTRSRTPTTTATTTGRGRTTLGPAAAHHLDDTTLHRLQQELDLTRIGDCLFAAGLPWRRASDRRSHRNNVEDLARFLNG